MKRFKIFILYILSIAISITPLLIYFLMNRDRYLCTKTDAIKLFSGGFIVLIMLVLKALKKLKMPSGVWFFGLICILSYLLAPILKDLVIISFLGLVGEIGDMIVQVFISREKSKLQSEKTAKELKKLLG